MRTRETALVAIMLGMVGLASAYRLYEFETKPFDTAAFVASIVSKGYMVSYDPEAKDSSVDIHINQPYRSPDHFHEVFAYFIDSDRIEDPAAE